MSKIRPKNSRRKLWRRPKPAHHIDKLTRRSKFDQLTAWDIKRMECAKPVPRLGYRESTEEQGEGTI